MTPQFREARNRIQASVTKWDCLIPGWCDVDHVFIEGLHDEDPDTLAETFANWKYHNAKVKWYLPVACAMTDDYLEGTVVHELVHVLLSPVEQRIPSKYEEQSEFAVESIAKAILRTRKVK